MLKPEELCKALNNTFCLGIEDMSCFHGGLVLQPIFQEIKRMMVLLGVQNRIDSQHN